MKKRVVSILVAVATIFTMIGGVKAVAGWDGQYVTCNDTNCGVCLLCFFTCGECGEIGVNICDCEGDKGGNPPTPVNPRPNLSLNYELGDINGDTLINIADYLELLWYLAGFPSVLDNDPLARAAADVNSDGVIDIEDVFQLEKIILRLRGNVPFTLANIRAEIDVKAGVIRYITNEVVSNRGIHLLFTVTGNDIFVENPSAPNRNSGSPRLPVSSQILVNPYSDNDIFFEVTIWIEEMIPAGTVVAVQFFEGDAYSIDIHGPGLTGFTIINEGATGSIGAIDSDKEYTINDALEILKFLAGLDNKLTSDPVAFAASLITGGDEPSIEDVLEILKYLAGLPNLISKEEE